MALLGNAAMVAWHNLAPGKESDHDEWHAREHLFERVAIPGFRRGRRCRSTHGNEAYFLMYEVDSLATLTSSAYRERLNDPTSWSQQIIPTICDMTRTLCRIEASQSRGLGTHLLTIRLTANPDQREHLVGWLTNLVLAELHTHTGITGAHLLRGDAEASGEPTDEMRLRGGGDRCADLILLVEAYQSAVLESLTGGPLATPQLLEHGANNTCQVGLYRVAQIVSEADLDQNSSA
ncbi:MAG TPA: hypothetical protein DCY79_10685 [Planctomycetaceae bacterium]|nr:hypothetical protein [Blastopirellula sp.]HAY80260.1 hypothetical protein [Planctomycetaceae bacterium]